MLIPEELCLSVMAVCIAEGLAWGIGAPIIIVVHLPSAAADAYGPAKYCTM